MGDIMLGFSSWSSPHRRPHTHAHTPSAVCMLRVSVFLKSRSYCSNRTFPTARTPFLSRGSALPTFRPPEISISASVTKWEPAFCYVAPKRPFEQITTRKKRRKSLKQHEKMIIIVRKCIFLKWSSERASKKVWVCNIWWVFAERMAFKHEENESFSS